MPANLSNDRRFVEFVELGIITCSKKGIVTNVRRGTVINRVINSGYEAVFVQDPDTKKTRQMLVHRLVWCLFKGFISDSKLEINHKDGDTLNNKLSNLELVTHKNNIRHSHKILGNIPLIIQKGNKNPNSKFTSDQVKTLRKAFATKNVSLIKLADKFDVHKSTIFLMLRGDTYGSVRSKYTKICRKLLPRVGKGHVLGK